MLGNASRLRDVRECLILAGVAAHFGLGVSLGDEPRSEARRDVPNHAALQTVEANAIHFGFSRRFLYSNLQAATKGSAAHTSGADTQLLLAAARVVPVAPHRSST